MYICISVFCSRTSGFCVILSHEAPMTDDQAASVSFVTR